MPSSKHPAYATFQEYLAKNQLKLTPQRMRILEAFLRSKGHIASEELYEQVKKLEPSVGQATVYRTLKLLTDSGLAREVHFGDGLARYEQADDEDHHDHLICERCGKNLEVVDERIETLQEELAAQHGYTLTSHRMYLYGICPDCKEP